MAKKIFSLALAVVMLCSVFAFSASALELANGKYAWRVVTDAYVGQESGTVTAYVYFDLPDSTDFSTYRQNLGNTYIGYTSEFEFVGYEWCGNYAGYFTDDKYNTGVWAQVTKTANDTANGYTNGVLIQMLFDKTKTTEFTAKTGYPIDQFQPHIKITFNVVDTLTVASKIGCVEGSYTKQSYIKSHDVATGRAVNIALADVDFSQAVTAAHYVNINALDGVKTRSASESGKMDIGLTGEFKNDSFQVTFVEGTTTCENLTNIGFEAKVNGVPVTATDDYIYPTADGYKFRAVLSNVDAATAAQAVEARMFITTDAGTFYSDWLYLTPDMAHDIGVANGMPAIFA